MTEGYAIDIDRPPDLVQAADLRLAKVCSGMLQLHYPGHPWGVSADHKNGIVVVRNWGLGQRWGFVLKIKDLAGDPLLKEVVRAGGELLERFRIRRFKARVEDYARHHALMRPDL